MYKNIYSKFNTPFQYKYHYYFFVMETSLLYKNSILKSNLMTTSQGTVNNTSTPGDTTNNKPVPFRRVATEKIEVDPRLKDNSFDAKVNAHKFDKPRQLYV